MLRRSRVSAALSMAALSTVGSASWVRANSGTQLPLTQYNAGSEVTTAGPIVNPGFEQPGFPGPNAPGWTSSGPNMQVVVPDPLHLPNPPSAIGSFSAQANQTSIFNVEQYSQNITLTANTDYVLSAYIWNYGVSHPDGIPDNFFPGDLAVVQTRDTSNFFNVHGIGLEPQPFNGAPGQGVNGYFVYKYFNSRQYPGGQVTLEVHSDPNEDVAGARPTRMAQFDNIALTPVTQFSSQKWNINGSGNWGNNPNWQNGQANHIDAIASFLGVITSAATVTLDAPKSVSVINFNNVNQYTLAGASTLTLSHSETFEDALVNVIAGDHVISAPVSLGRTLRVDVQQAGDSLTIQNQVSVGTTTIGTVKNGAGKLFMKNVRMPLTINAGSVSILTDGGDAATSNISTLSIAGARQGGPTATLDLNNNDLLVGNNSYGNIASLVAAARNGGSWDQPGITSTAARGPGATMLGVVTGAEYTSAGGGPLFSGQPFLPGDVLVKYTWYGDSDLNGEVNFDDYVRTDTGFNSGLSGWVNGDFDLSGSIDFDDYVLLDLGFNAQSGTLRRAMSYLSGEDRSTADMNTPSLRFVQEHFEQFGVEYASNFLTAVPEPTGALFISGVVASATMLRRRRR